MKLIRKKDIEKIDLEKNKKPSKIHNYDIKLTKKEKNIIDRIRNANPEFKNKRHSRITRILLIIGMVKYLPIYKKDERKEKKVIKAIKNYDMPEDIKNFLFEAITKSNENKRKQREFSKEQQLKQGKILIQDNQVINIENNSKKLEKAIKKGLEIR
jgi:hypothetical protein